MNSKQVPKVMRSVAEGGEEAKFEESEFVTIEPKKTLDTYEHVFSQNTQFFSTYNPDMIEDALVEYLKNTLKVEPKLHDKKYKTKFTIACSDHQIEICVRILKVDDNRVCVEFSKLGGNQIRFLDHFKEFKDKALSFANDINLST